MAAAPENAARTLHIGWSEGLLYSESPDELVVTIVVVSNWVENIPGSARDSVKLIRDPESAASAFKVIYV